MIYFKRLRDIREDNDLNQSEMANILGVKRGRYSLWELGINIIPLNYLCAFADYFDCSIDYVLGLSNKKKEYEIKKRIDLHKLGNNLKDLRKKNNLSQEDMAKILKVSQACINKYEKGKIQISTSNLYKISKKFKVSLNQLCDKTKKIDIIKNINN